MTDRRHILAYLGLHAAGALALGAVPTSASASTPQLPVGRDASRAEQMKRFFPNVPLRTHDDRPVRFYDDLVKGRKVIINFTFTSCTNTCPRTTSNLARVQDILGDRVGRDIFLVSLTLDPETDTPAVLKQYARTFNARPGWTFATGRREDITSVRRALGLSGEGDYTQHAALLTFGNEPEGKWGATPALDTPQNILYWVLRRVDPYKYTPWPNRLTTAGAAGTGSEGGR